MAAFPLQARLDAPDWAPRRPRTAAARRDWRWLADEGDEIAFEIAFLADQGVARASLLAATRAADSKIWADEALLGEGHMREDAFYRLLARHVGLPYYRGDIAIAECRNPAEAAARGSVRLAPNSQGLRAVLAPRGQALAALLEAFAAGRLPTAYAIASPQTLGAIVRRQKARQVAGEAAGALERMDASMSAHSGLARWQAACALLLASCMLAGGLRQPEALASVSAVVLWVIFGAAAALRLAATAAGGLGRDAALLEDFELPVYSIIAPLKREANVVGRLVEAIEAIDYPRRKLDIKIVIERDDEETLTALARMRLPSRYDVIVAPPGRPTTKPRALNVALLSARGEFIVVYDAEDTPDPDQLRRAAARFAQDSTIDCLQARLAVDNIDQSWLTRLFAMEYAALFDVVNPGLAALNAPIALGGSSNHFRTQALRRVGGWDAWNVTEDADLGLRLARFGRRVATLDSDTREEAPPRLKPWLGQRCRWLKGWYQTLAVHLRDPRRLVGELGLARALAAQALVLGAALGGLLGPPFAAYALFRCLTGKLFAASSILEFAGNATTLLLMFLGLHAVLLPIVIALRGRGLQRLYGALPLLPVYYCLVSIAAWAALIDLVRRPYHWTKTEHGFSDAANRPSPDIRD